MTSFHRISLFVALAFFLSFGAVHTLVFAQADGSLGVGGDCENNPSACAAPLICASNPNGDDTCQAAGGSGQVSCGVGTVAAGSSCVQCPNGDSADTLADCPTDGVAPGGTATGPVAPGGTATGPVAPGGTATGAVNPGGTAVNGSSQALLNPLNASNLQDLLNEVLGYIIGLATIALVIMLVYVGFLFVAARGNSEKVSQARQMLMWTVIGGLLILGAQALELVIQQTIQGL